MESVPSAVGMKGRKRFVVVGGAWIIYGKTSVYKPKQLNKIK